MPAAFCLRAIMLFFAWHTWLIVQIFSWWPQSTVILKFTISIFLYIYIYISTSCESVNTAQYLNLLTLVNCTGPVFAFLWLAHSHNLISNYCFEHKSSCFPSEWAKANAANSDLPLTEWPVVATLPDRENDPSLLINWSVCSFDLQDSRTVANNGVFNSVSARQHQTFSCLMPGPLSSCMHCDNRFWYMWELLNFRYFSTDFGPDMTRLRLAYYWGYNLAESSPGLICLPLSECLFLHFDLFSMRWEPLTVSALVKLLSQLYPFSYCLKAPHCHCQ